MTNNEMLRSLEHPRERRGKVLVLLAVVLSLAVSYVLVVILPLIWWRKRKAFLQLSGGAVLVGESQFPVLHQCVQTAQRFFGSDRRVEVFVVNDGEVNASFFRSFRRCVLVINSGAVDELSGGELDFVVRRFLAYLSIRRVDWGAFVQVIDVVQEAPLFKLLLRPYDQGAVLSSDRLGAATCVDSSVAMTTLLKFLVGSTLAASVDFDALRKQAESVQGNPLSYAAHAFHEHPRLLDRVIELDDWTRAGGLTQARHALNG